MKKLLIMSFALLLPIASQGQENYSEISGRAIFPIVNMYEGSTTTEFIAAEAIDGNEYAPRIPHYYRAQKMWLFKGASHTLIQTDDFGLSGFQTWFVSHNYISQTKGNGVTWNSGANTPQFVFHPGNHSNEKDVLYSFLWVWTNLDKRKGDLYLVDVTNTKIIAKLATDFKGMGRASINVFANMNCSVSDMLVVTDEDGTFLVYDKLPSKITSVSQVSEKVGKQQIYDIGGNKRDVMQRGINIVKLENGETKKLVK